VSDYGRDSNATSLICMTGSVEEHIERYHPGGDTYQSPTVGSGHSPSRR